MEEYTSHKPGTFCWVDLSTTNALAAKKFYSEIFGWQVVDIPIDEKNTYTMLNINGKPVAGLAQMMPDQLEKKFPPHWMSYISVASASETMAKAKELGGNVIMDAMDVMEEGRTGVFQDPEGAMVAIWEPKNHKGASYKNIPGTLCWVEHGSHEKEKAIPFLEKLFDWNAKTEKMGEVDYTTFFLGEEMIGGLYEFQPDMKDIPSHWLPYFTVENIDETIEKTSKLNGKIIMPKMYVKGVGHFSVLQDPQGAVFGVLHGDPM
jgi:uncharacterized protein